MSECFLYKAIFFILLYFCDLAFQMAAICRTQKPKTRIKHEIDNILTTVSLPCGLVCCIEVV